MTGLVFLLQIGLLVLLVTASLHLLRSAAFAWSLPAVDRRAGTAPFDPRGDGPRLPPLSAVPRVTVQVPLFNEIAVAGRVIRAACRLAWPRERLEVQVLDDSTDETAGEVAMVVAELRGQGHDVSVVRREARTGYKAGALQNGMALCKGEFIAVLDADSVPDEDFLRRLVPVLLGDPELGFVQGRWSFDNEDASLLTRVQAVILHGLMLVEQSRLSALGLPLQFNGSAGIWRRSALELAGGWLAETDQGPQVSVTEDLDLSYRAHLLGLGGRTVPEVAVRTELPETMAAFRVQQQRWVRGGAQVLRSLHLRLRAGTGLSADEKMTMLGHLLRHGRQPYLLLLCAWLPLAGLDVVRTPLSLPGLWPALVGLTLGAVGAYYAAALRRLSRPALDGFVLAPVVVALSLGLSLCLSVALFRGLLGGLDGAVFERTPKRGERRVLTYQPPRDGLAVGETVIGAAYVVLGAVALSRGDWPTAATFWGLMSGGFLWVGLGSLRWRLGP